jgi:hypothetical protein
MCLLPAACWRGLPGVRRHGGRVLLVALEWGGFWSGSFVELVGDVEAVAAEGGADAGAALAELVVGEVGGLPGVGIGGLVGGELAQVGGDARVKGRGQLFWRAEGEQCLHSLSSS